jgi:hypothetical protein
MSPPGAKRAEWSRIPCGRWSDSSDNQPATQHDGISTLLLLVPSSWADAVENVILGGPAAMVGLIRDAMADIEFTTGSRLRYRSEPKLAVTPIGASRPADISQLRRRFSRGHKRVNERAQMDPEAVDGGRHNLDNLPGSRHPARSI